MTIKFNYSYKLNRTLLYAGAKLGMFDESGQEYVGIGLVPEVLEWCDANLNKEWCFEIKYDFARMKFIDLSDAIFFKLRWSDGILAGDDF
jgi:hypothetical protein